MRRLRIRKYKKYLKQVKYKRWLLQGRVITTKYVRAFYRSSMIKPHHYIEFKKNQKIKFLAGTRYTQFNILRALRFGQKVLYNQELRLQY